MCTGLGLFFVLAYPLKHIRANTFLCGDFRVRFRVVFIRRMVAICLLLMERLNPGRFLFWWAGKYAECLPVFPAKFSYM